jgi:hypothetical protein
MNDGDRPDAPQELGGGVRHRVSPDALYQNSPDALYQKETATNLSGKKQLITRCGVCGQRLSVLTRQERPSPELPDERVEVPVGKPICPVGHVYRMAPDEPYPD